MKWSNYTSIILEGETGNTETIPEANDSKVIVTDSHHKEMQ